MDQKADRGRGRGTQGKYFHGNGSIPKNSFRSNDGSSFRSGSARSSSTHSKRQHNNEDVRESLIALGITNDQVSISPPQCPEIP